MEQFRRFLNVVVGAMVIWFIWHVIELVLFNGNLKVSFNPINMFTGLWLTLVPFMYILFSRLIGEPIVDVIFWCFNPKTWSFMRPKEKVKFPCNFDHNGECLVCDCGFENCAYDRWVKRDYTYENEAELDKMFEGYKKIKTYPDDKAI